MDGDNPSGDTSPNPLPEQLQGKTAAEVYSMLQQEHEREIEKARFETTEAVIQKIQPSQPAQQFQPPPVQRLPEPPAADLFTNPNEFMDQQFQKRMQPLVNSFIESQRASNREIFKTSIGEKEWTKYGKEIEDFVEGSSPQIKAQLGVYQGAYTLVRGKYVEEIAKEKAVKLARDAMKRMTENPDITDEQYDQYLQEPVAQPPQRSSLFQPVTGIQGSTPPVPRNSFSMGTKRSVLTPAEQKAARAFDMSDDEYVKARDA